MSDTLERIRPTLREDTPRSLALSLLLRLVVGDASPEVIGWLRPCLLRWLRSNGELSLSQRLRLGNSPRAARIALRNLWLVDAAAYVSAPTLWARSVGLHREVEHFVRYRWPSWRKHDDPPAGCTMVEACLHRAALTHDLPSTARHLHAILSDAF